jgi:hypothetical protein
MLLLWLNKLRPLLLFFFELRVNVNTASDLHRRIRWADQIYLHQTDKGLFNVFELDDREDDTVVLNDHFIFTILKLWDIWEELLEWVVWLPKSTIRLDLFSQPLS